MTKINNIVVYTGIEGYLLYLEAIEMEFYKHSDKQCEPWSAEKKEEVRQSLLIK